MRQRSRFDLRVWSFLSDLDFGVKPLLDLFPHGVRPRTEDVAARDIVVIDHLARRDDLRPEDQIHNSDREDTQKAFTPVVPRTSVYQPAKSSALLCTILSSVSFLTVLPEPSSAPVGLGFCCDLPPPLTAVALGAGAGLATRASAASPPAGSSASPLKSSRIGSCPQCFTNCDMRAQM